MGPENQRVEVQIRTQEMHEVAERGVAAHWTLSREGQGERRQRDDSAYEWLRDMVDLLGTRRKRRRVLRAFKLSLYQDQVFCFTPKGMLIALPRGATPIDFAYFVHTDVGNTAVGAKVNGVHTPLHTPLKNGDQVEIIRSKEQTPSPLWERFVVTGRARAEIRRYLRHTQRDQHVALGPQDPGEGVLGRELRIDRQGRRGRAEEASPRQGRRCLCRCRPRRAPRRRSASVGVSAAQARSQAQAAELCGAEFHRASRSPASPKASAIAWARAAIPFLATASSG